ncbi:MULTISPECIES: hypothetical protein [unclassified Chitinophaga]|uniref:hypothetical protein n=1 Tax=unclassified Chitinophaga TaxID=2619133 RepID=UPI00300FF1BE
MSFNYSSGFLPNKELENMIGERIEKIFAKMDFQSLKYELNQVIYILSDLMNDTKHTPSPDWRKPMESLLIKLAYHASTMGRN